MVSRRCMNNEKSRAPILCESIDAYANVGDSINTGSPSFTRTPID